MSKLYKMTMINLIKVIARVRDSKKIIEKNKFLLDKSKMNSKENSVKSIDLLQEKDLNDELICLINTTADISNLKKNKNL